MKDRLGLLAAVSACALATPALAQERDLSVEATRPADADDQSAEVVVTGTRIARRGYDAPAPVAVLTGDSIQGQGNTNLGDVVSRLPQLSGSSSLAGSLQIGQPGLNLLDLRGLGTNRTLVLIDGKRHVASLADSAAVDINTIPTDMVERVEVVTGGASAVYGADAVTGAVNFILKDRFDGLSLRAQYGDRDGGSLPSYFASLTGGATAMGGRLRVIVNVEGSYSSALYSREVKRGSGGYVANPANTGPADGIVDTFYQENLRYNYAVPEGQLFAFSPSLRPGFTFNQDGSLRPFNPGTTVYNGGTIGQGPGDGVSLDYSPVSPELKRIGLNAKLSFDVADGVTLYLEPKYVHTETRYREGAPLTVAEDYNIFQIQSDNAYLTPAARQTLANAGVPVFFLGRFIDDITELPIAFDRDLYRAVIGMKGDRGGWRYDLSYNYGRADIRTEFRDDPLKARFANARDAVIDAAGILGQRGAPVCRVRLADALTGRTSTDPAVSQCVPVNVLGRNVTQEARDFINTTSSARDRLTEHVVSGSLGRNLFRLPGGPVAFVVGAEYRSESLSRRADDVLARGLASHRSQSVNGRFDVWEAFGEVSAPILAERPFFHELTIDGAARYADYSTAGSNTSWKGGVNWAPVKGLRLRGTISQAVRAPNIVELFQPQSIGSTFFVDPCDVNSIGNNPSRAANCRAIGVPAGFIEVRNSRQLPILAGGNPDLQPERARTYTLGAVLAPTFLRGFTASVDWYSIRLRDAVTGTGATTILEQCVDGPQPDPLFCGLVTRDASGRVTRVVSTLQNAAALRQDGLDIDATYATGIGGGRLTLHAGASKLLKRKSFPFQSNPTFVQDQRGLVGTPDWVVRGDAQVTQGRLTGSYTMRFVSESSQRRKDQIALNPDLIAPRTIKAQSYHDLQLRYAATDKIEGYAGVNNVFDNAIPYGIGAQSGSPRGLYDVVGRFFYGGIKVRY